MSSRLISDLMTDKVHTVRPDSNLAELAEVFDRYDVRHVPVVDEQDDIVGLVSDRDLLRNVLTDQVDVPLTVRQAALEATPVESIMTLEVVTLEPNDTLNSAARILLDNKFGCVPVVEGTRLVGIVTQADFLQAFVDGIA